MKIHFFLLGILLIATCAVAGLSDSKKVDMKVFDHDAHMEIVEDMKLDCTACHTNMDDFAVKESPCHTCHRKDGEISAPAATKDCAACHVSAASTKPADHVAQGWTRAHGTVAAQESTNCSACHTERYCVDCHNTRQPGANIRHSGGFIFSHNIEAAADPASCAACHKPAFCIECHTR